MSPRRVLRLVRKDLSLHRTAVVLYAIAGAAAAVLAALPLAPARSVGLSLALCAAIGSAFHLVFVAALGERERRTLPFLLALPVTPAEQAAAKVVATLVLAAPAAAVLAGVIGALSPVDASRLAREAGAGPLAIAAGWAGWLALVVAAWLAAVAVPLAVAVASESTGATMAASFATMLVAGNGLGLAASRSPAVAAFLKRVLQGGSERTLATALAAAFTLAVGAAAVAWYSRKRSFV